MKRKLHQEVSKIVHIDCTGGWERRGCGCEFDELFRVMWNGKWKTFSAHAVKLIPGKCEKFSGRGKERGNINYCLFGVSAID